MCKWWASCTGARSQGSGSRALGGTRGSGVVARESGAQPGSRVFIQGHVGESIGGATSIASFRHSRHASATLRRACAKVIAAQSCSIRRFRLAGHLVFPDLENQPIVSRGAVEKIDLVGEKVIPDLGL